MWPALTPAREAGTRFPYPGGMEGWVDLGGWVHIKMVCTKLHRFAPIFWQISRVYYPDPQPSQTPPPQRRRGCRRHIPTNILVGWDINRNMIFLLTSRPTKISPNIITYFKFITSEFTKICHFEITKQKIYVEGHCPRPRPTPFGASSPQSWTRVDATASAHRSTFSELPRPQPTKLHDAANEYEY